MNWRGGNRNPFGAATPHETNRLLIGPEASEMIFSEGFVNEQLKASSSARIIAIKARKAAPLTKVERPQLASNITDDLRTTILPKIRPMDDLPR